MRTFAGQHLDELDGPEGGVEQQDARTAFAGGEDGFEEAPVIAGQDGHAGARTQPAPTPLVGQRVSAGVEVGETQRATLVDQRHAVRVSRSGDHRGRPQDP